MLISRRMNLLPADLAYLRDQLSELAATLQERWESMTTGDDDSDSPRLIGDASTQLLDMLNLSTRGQTSTSIKPTEITALGEYGLHLFADLETMAARLESPEIQARIEQLTLPFALWIARHGGEIRNLAPAVNALAQLANRASEPREMASLYAQCCELIDAASPACEEGRIENDHPWRLLLLNRAIVATRSHKPELMNAAFDAVVEQLLPADAQRFFSEGMEQMSALDYPDHVREVMKRYYIACAKPRRLH